MSDTRAFAFILAYVGALVVGAAALQRAFPESEQAKPIVQCDPVVVDSASEHYRPYLEKHHELNF